jgi:RNA polymerase sigma-70 factor (ECF subfamily)
VIATIPDGDGSTDPVAAARAGDPAAQAALIRRYYPMVHALCVRLLGDQDRALDIAQEAAVEAILGLGRLRHDDRFGAWMAGIGLNLCRRLVRDRDWAVFSLDALLQDRLIGEPADAGPGPAEAAEAAEIARRVKDAVRALPAGQRRAAEAYYLSGLSQAEAAAHLGIPAGAVKARLHKARGALAASGARLREVRITSLTDDVFYAQAVLASGTVVDARPSDALNLAAISDAPVYVAAGLLSAGREYSSDGPPG